MDQDVGRSRTRRRGCGPKLLAAAIGFVLAGCSGPEAAAPTNIASPSVEEAPTLPPEERLLLYTNDGPVILGPDEDEPIYLQRPDEAIWADDLSPDGSKVLALPFQQEPTGITREPKILVIDTATGQRSTAVRVGPRGDLGPALWSPDGARIAYRLTFYPVDPAKVHPGPRSEARPPGPMRGGCVLLTRSSFPSTSLTFPRPASLVDSLPNRVVRACRARRAAKGRHPATIAFRRQDPISFPGGEAVPSRHRCGACGSL